MRKLSEQTICRMQKAARQLVLTAGTSPLEPITPFMELWSALFHDMSSYSLRISPISGPNRYAGLGTDFDFLIGPFDGTQIQECTFIPLGSCRFAVSVVRSHPLAALRSVSFSDLDGHSLLIMNAGTSPINDRIRTALEAACPNAVLIGSPAPYSIGTFNRCADTGTPLLSLMCWNQVHPALKTVPLAEDFTMPYGLIAPARPDGQLQTFLDILRTRTDGRGRKL